MLTVKERQQYMHDIGINIGAVDGIEGVKTRAGYKTLQGTYFSRNSDIDGIYGNNTDILLKTVHNFIGIKHFKPSEFKCECGGKCTGYPAVVNHQLLRNLDYLREATNTPILITSGLRCKPYNAKIGGIAGSLHTQGRAADFYSKALTDTAEKRRNMVLRWKSFKKNHYAYANTPQMGNAVHVDVYE